MYVRHSAHRGGALRAHQKQPGHVNRDRAFRRVFSSCPWPPPGTSGGTRVWFEGTYVSNGTVPEGSMWARNPLPRNDHQDTFAGFAPACEEADDCDVTSRLDPMRCRCSGTSPLHHPRPGMYNAVLRPDRFGTGHRLGIENAPAGGPSQITDHIPAEVSRTCLGSASEVPRKRLVPAQACGGRTTSRSSTRWRCRPTCRTESGCSAGGGTARSRTRCGPRAPT